MFVLYSCRGLVSVRLCVWGELRHWSLDKTLGLIGTPSHPPPPFCLHLHPDPIPHFYRNSSRRSRFYNNRPFWGSWNCPSILLHTDLSLPLFCLSFLPTNTSATLIDSIHFRNSSQNYTIFYFELSFINLTSKLFWWHPFQKGLNTSLTSGFPRRRLHFQPRGQQKTVIVCYYLKV